MGLISGTAAYLQADGTGKSTEEKRQAFIDSYITGAFMGAGGGAVGAAVGHFVEGEKPKSDEPTPLPTPAAPKIEPEKMIYDMQGLRGGSIDHVQISKEQLDALPWLGYSQEAFHALPFKQKMDMLNRISQKLIKERFKDAERYGFDKQSGSFTVDGTPLSYKEFLSHFAESAAADIRRDFVDNESTYERGVGSATITRYALSGATEGGLHTAKLGKHGEDGLNVPRDVDPFLYQKDAPEITASVKGMFEAKGEGGVITLMKSSDITTIYHETAHYFERTFVPEEKAHFDAIYGEYAEGRARSEAFAEGFVRWVADGWYGTKEQHGLFAKFARFIRETFRQIPDSNEANFKLTPQMQLFYRAMLGDAKAKAALHEAIKRRDDGGVESKIKPANESNPNILYQKDAISSFKEAVLNDEKPTPLELGRVTKEQAARLKELTGLDFSGYKRVLTFEFIRHIKNRHPEDLGLIDDIPQIINDFDFAEKSITRNEQTGKTEVSLVLYKKDDDKIVKSVELRDFGDKSLSFKTLFTMESTDQKLPTALRLSPSAQDNSSFSSRPYPHSDGLGDILYQSGQEVKPEDVLFIRPTEDMKGFWQKWVDNVYRGATAIVDSKKFDNVRWVRRVRENLLLHANRGELYLDHLTEFRMRLSSGYDMAVDLGKALAKELTPVEREVLTRKLEGETAEADRLRSENPDIDLTKIDDHYAKIRAQIDTNAAKLKELGALRDEDNIKDYIKRVYQKQIDEANSAGSAVFGGDTSHSRGVEKTITVKDAFADDFSVGETLKIGGFEYKVLESNQKLEGLPSDYFFIKPIYRLCVFGSNRI